MALALALALAMDPNGGDMSDGKMPRQVRDMLARRKEERRARRRGENPSPGDFDAGDLAAAVDWVVQEMGLGAPGGPHEPVGRLGDVATNQAPFVYLRYARAMDEFLARHLARAVILKSAGPGHRLVSVYHRDPVREVVKFLCGGKVPRSWAPGAKYVGCLQSYEMVAWVGYTRSQQDKVRELLRKAGGDGAGR
jgi:hypothetical protein